MQTEGINPVHQDEKAIQKVLAGLRTQIFNMDLDDSDDSNDSNNSRGSKDFGGSSVSRDSGGFSISCDSRASDKSDDSVGIRTQDPRKWYPTLYFYGAGCAGVYAEKIASLLHTELSASEVFVGGDLLGAARALLGSSEGVACILGTGSNSGLYDGQAIVENVPPLGYILGDEGSGAVLGRMFVNWLLKENTDEALVEKFYKAHGIDYADLIEGVYRRPLANRFLASFAPFIHSCLYIKEVEALVIDNFRNFLRHNVAHYARPDLPVCAVGSIASAFSSQWHQALSAEGFIAGKIIKAPMEGLIEYHQKK